MTSNANYHLFRQPDMCFLQFSLFLIASLTLSLGLCEESAAEEDEAKKEDKKSFAAILENCESTEGLFPIHQDKTTGTLYLEISDKQLSGESGKPEFIHFSHTLDGVAELDLFRGQFSRSRVFSLHRHFERIEFVAENTSFYFNPNSALKRAASANVSEAILASPKIEASDETMARHLIKADSIFLNEFLRQLKPGK